MESFIKKKQSNKYFEITKGGEQKYSEESIQLNFDLINGKENYFYSLHLKNLETPTNIIQSESIKITNKDQANTLLKYNYYYSFQKYQKLNIIVIINDLNESKQYPINITIGEIIGSEKSSKLFYIKGDNNQEEEILEIRAEKMKKNILYLTIHFNLKIVSNQEGVEITDEEKEKYLISEKNKLYFVVEQENKMLYESESFTDDGKFNMVQIPLNLINQKFSISFFDWKNQKLSTINTSIKELTDKTKEGEIYFSKQLSLNDKLNIYNYSSIKEEITFLDYIYKGMKLGLDIGIDFTGSNYAPDEPRSLHYCGNMEKRNPYERAILSCATIMANYDYDKLFPVYGFGAIIKGQKSASMCFNINFKNDPNIKYVENILKEYHNCMDKIYFSGPTYFSPIINKVVEEIKKQNDIFEYHVLMILTDGIIEDMEETIEALVEGSFYPLSVIIIGIGEYDFKKMEQLDGDEIPLISKKGVKRQRDLVQFVPFNKFEGDENKLSQEVLDEIPRQVIEFYTLNFIYPDSINNDKSSSINKNDNMNINEIKDIFDSKIYEGSINPLNNSQKYETIKDNPLINSIEFDNYYKLNKKISK